MFSIQLATKNDKAYWFTLDKHMAESEFDRKVLRNECFLIFDDNVPMGVLRYNLFWDNTPFLTLIYLEEKTRGKGLGGKAMAYWEAEMRRLGYGMLMTSTQADEEAQHFYRKLGYKDAGCLVLDTPPYAQPLEIFLVKYL